MKKEKIKKILEYILYAILAICIPWTIYISTRLIITGYNNYIGEKRMNAMHLQNAQK